MVIFLPVVDSKHDIFLVKSPTVRQLRNKGTINHVPQFLVVLKFLLQNGIQHRTTFSYGVASEFGEDVWFSGVIFGTHPLDIFDNLICHVLVVVVKKHVGFDRPASSDVHGVQTRCHSLQLHILLNKAGQFRPIICRVLDA